MSTQATSGILGSSSIPLTPQSPMLRHNRTFSAGTPVSRSYDSQLPIPAPVPLPLPVSSSRQRVYSCNSSSSSSSSLPVDDYAIHRAEVAPSRDAALGGCSGTVDRFARGMLSPMGKTKKNSDSFEGFFETSVDDRLATLRLMQKSPSQHAFTLSSRSPSPLHSSSSSSSSTPRSSNSSPLSRSSGTPSPIPDGGFALDAVPQFQKEFNKLDHRSPVKRRLEQIHQKGNFGDSHPVKGEVSELRFMGGPERGMRVYYHASRHGNGQKAVTLLNAGGKNGQDDDINLAVTRLKKTKTDAPPVAFVLSPTTPDTSTTLSTPSFPTAPLPQ